MSNLEHLIENGLCRLQECNSYTEWCEIMQQDVNWNGNEELFITVDTLWEICQYVIYTWCGTCEPNEWIKCSDEMPEEQETIFAKFKGTDKWSPAMFSQSSEDVRVVIVFADGTRRVSHSHTIDGKWECEKSPLKRTVTHWMPNPKLPKEGL